MEKISFEWAQFKERSRRPKLAEYVSVVVIAVLVAIDQYTKWLVVKHIELYNVVRGVHINCDCVSGEEACGGFVFVDITHVTNEGMAFGLFSGWQIPLIVLTSIAIIAAMVYVLTGRVKRKLMLAALTLAIAGGVGNLIDRVRLHEVIDFITFGFVNYATFNAADVFVVAGMILLCMVVIPEEIREFRARRACE
ncbi:MAG: signal peptidase II, partial [Oscillospiraceae bacterium]|nr:signal peptidase II [Oscillospiraceae bacterium]